ncbi:metal-dependent hydrolase [Alkalicoccus daliensis]|uniref:Inner membrane protein n=1 Tax=Alkalicoccus daliensis TaxID=745820 RepID=A0A1H0IRP2_9BACI|nr:metal-dependent hydrolase [Alkalicoccus daliensis]SDO34124.1 inner membrane protein [Alkalicoccus daliensis]
MRYYTHIAVAAGSALLLHQYELLPFSNEIGVAAVSGLMLGAVLPDIDETKSWIGRRSRGLAFWVKLLFGHRGMTHSGIVLALLIYLVFTLDQPFFAALCFGAASHILADLFSRGGIPLFYPVEKKRTSIPVYKTGSFLEHLIFLGILFYIMALLFV